MSLGRSSTIESRVVVNLDTSLFIEHGDSFFYGNRWAVGMEGHKRDYEEVVLFGDLRELVCKVIHTMP